MEALAEFDRKARHSKNKRPGERHRSYQVQTSAIRANAQCNAPNYPRQNLHPGRHALSHQEQQENPPCHTPNQAARPRDRACNPSCKYSNIPPSSYPCARIHRLLARCTRNHGKSGPLSLSWPLLRLLVGKSGQRVVTNRQKRLEGPEDSTVDSFDRSLLSGHQH